MDKVSVIMPCFNDGKYISESIKSVLSQTYENIELIIINDGSTDVTTFSIFNNLQDEKITKIENKQNKGPSYARNLGIKIATGKYILCLDADDVIDENYINKAVNVMNQDDNIGIVYCMAKLFGNVNKILDLPDYSLKLMIERNLIFVSALFKKSDWEKVGGFDETLIDGLEDYDFWLSIISLNIKVVRIPEILFFYRKKDTSRNQQIMYNESLNKITLNKIYKKHKDLFLNLTTNSIKNPIKKIFVCMYLAHNLGDDLFLDTLCKKYPNCQFTINYTNNDYDEFLNNYDNLYRIVGAKDLNKIALEYDAIIYIGGSLFQEVPISTDIYNVRLNIIEKFKNLDKPVFILGSNFGPYKSTNFFEMYEKFLGNCDDVCFRDKYSYNLLKHLPNVRYAPDIAFQSDLYKNYTHENDSKKVGFSVINLKNRPNLSKYYDKYIDSLCKCIKKLINKGYDCYLISFCSNEGDLDAINDILSKLDSAYLKNIFVYDYKSNLEFCIKLISTFELFIATRFHAIIIGLCLGINILPIIYDIKVLNTLKDLNLDNLIIEFDYLENLYNDIVLKSSFNNKLQDNSVKNNSIHHFDNLSIFINDINKNLENIEDKNDIKEVIHEFLCGKLCLNGIEFFLRNGTTLSSDCIKDLLAKLITLKPKSKNIDTLQNKLISVIVPLYNGSKTIIDTIDSILSQSYTNIEIIIIDDNSTDNSKDVIFEKYNNNKIIKYYRNDSNLDVGIARLKGYNLSNGEYIVFIDQDDFYIDPDFFKKCINLFNSYVNVSFISCNTFIYYQNLNKCKLNKLNLEFFVDRKEYFFNLQSSNYPKPTSTFPVMYSKKLLEIVNLKDIKFIGDSSLYQRALLHGTPLALDCIVGAYKIHQTNSTSNVSPQFIVNTLNGHILTKDLAIKRFDYDLDKMNTWLNLKADISIGWYLNTNKITSNNAHILLDWAHQNNVILSIKNKNRLDEAIKV